MGGPEDIGIPLPWRIVPAERVRRTIVVPDPAAGADFVVPVPGGVVWDVLSLKARLVTAAAVANRVPNLRITDGNEMVATIAQQQAFPAGGTSDLSWVRGWPGPLYGTVGTVLTNWFPEWPLYAGYTFGSITALIQAADQWSAVRVVVDEYEIRGLERAARRYAEAIVDAERVR